MLYIEFWIILVYTLYEGGYEVYMNQNVFDAVQYEYNYELERKKQLENKVYIALTFCGAIFLFIFRYFDFMKVYAVEVGCFWKVVCVILQVIAIAVIVLSVIRLINLLRAIKYLHIDCKELIDANVYKEDDKTSSTFLIIRMIAAKENNAETNERKARSFNRTIMLISADIILCVIIELIRHCLLGISGGL